ncbi:MAG: imidazole glycerol phosphate synthase subunit HisH [Bryobacterales bacterium]|nr:imidazole glycerol phosphate synthase subunit HisH [Bryobacteraceae bacterium]MDW8353654.1 imidazole glycerol phosphate synthase subunit HisH [Bryobacterales bacterium]
MIAILDYGAGNLRSVENALGAIGADYGLARSPAELERASKIILPGVGHFGQMMRALEELGVRATLLERIRGGVPFLGICLGLQALFSASEEAPEVAGLGLLPGLVRRFPSELRVPHMGWNRLEVRDGARLWAGVGEKPYVYFAHSYYAPVIAETAATCTYGVAYTAALEAGHVFGVQFHPEKSGPVGLRILRNFVQL